MRLCNKGLHDLDVVGKSNNGTCKICKREAERNRQRVKRASEARDLGTREGILTARAAALMHNMFAMRSPANIPIGEDLIWIVLNDRLWDERGQFAEAV